MATDTIPPTGVRGRQGQGGLGERISPSPGGFRGVAPPGEHSPYSSPRHTRPVIEPGAKPVIEPGAKPVTVAKRRTRSPRAPFILLLIGLLGGALVSLLVISTTLAQGTFQVASLQQQNANLTRQEQTLTNAVAQAADPAVIAKEAEQLGMRQDPDLRFINVKNGKIISGKVSKSDAEINVPGYAP
jgi:cell division protein FtsB